MCYMVRQQQPEREVRGSSLPAGPERVRPRWAGALVAALVGGVALAALMVPNSAPPEASVVAQRGAPLAPVVARASPAPQGTVLEPAAGIDDGVPSSGMKTAASPCHHGM